MISLSILFSGRGSNVLSILNNIAINKLNFKVKNIQLKRHIGATCLQSGKKKAVALLNNILEKGKTIGFDSMVYDIKGNAKELQVIDICILQELILRLYHKRKLNEKIWFMDYMNYVENNIKKFSI